jgi:hypothetical protein
LAEPPRLDIVPKVGRRFAEPLVAILLVAAAISGATILTFAAGPDPFRTAWFVESIATQILVISLFEHMDPPG